MSINADALNPTGFLRLLTKTNNSNNPIAFQVGVSYSESVLICFCYLLLTAIMFGGIIESPRLLQFRNAFLNEVFTRVARMSVNLSSESDYTRSVWFLICRYVPVTCNLKSEVWSTFSSDRVCGWKVILENTFGFQLVPNNFLFHTISAHTTKKDWVSFNRLTELS